INPIENLGDGTGRYKQEEIDRIIAKTNRYIDEFDVDGIHMDDYFYPYPVAGKEFPDEKSFAKYGKGMKRDDWRRQNVDQLIEGLHKLIAQKKPWVRFGVSPFGIWRNRSSDPRGSETNGLQNYDALYADVLLWTKNGWVDYMLPQLYWELEHKRASYLVLVDWWNKNANGRHMYIGQDVNKSMQLPDLKPSNQKTQLRHKVELTRKGENIQGNCWWPGYSITRNVGGVADSLANDLQSTIALPPSYPWITDEAPAKVKGVKIKNGVMSWTAPETQGAATDVNRFVVYRSVENKPEKAVNDPANIVAVTYENSFNLPAKKGEYYFVTALNRVNNESEPSMAVKNK
ncbi:MAG: family 10 glycosylhydrolase, partial [Muribaculaceae bacterium]|nr:family 10 glycosylhydrolase [Muribaculaceae bacterium]